MGTMVSFKRPDGKELQGYLAEPAQPNGAPAVVVIQEWWGLNDQIRGVADRLAHAGFLALVPDLYRGKKTVEQEEANHLMSALDFGDAAAQDVRGAAPSTRPAPRACSYCGAMEHTAASLTGVPMSAGVLYSCGGVSVLRVFEESHGDSDARQQLPRVPGEKPTYESQAEAIRRVFDSSRATQPMSSSSKLPS